MRTTRWPSLSTAGQFTHSLGLYPRATPPEVVEKILHLRRTYHFGPARIQLYLARYHGIRGTPSAIWRTLRHGVGRLPPTMRDRRHAARCQRHENPLPGQSLQVDVKCLAPLAGRRRYEQYTTIDGCSRLRVLKITQHTQQTALVFTDYARARLPLGIRCVQPDNGAECGPLIHWHLADCGIRHRSIRPRRPYLNGKTERSHRIDDEEFYRQLHGVVIASADEFNQRLAAWEHFYNFDRPHGALGGQTPYERLRERLQPNVTDVQPPYI